MLMNEWQTINKKLNNGDTFTINNKSMVYHFADKRIVSSTSPLNGGTTDALNSVFNFDETPESGGWCQMKAETYEGHLGVIANELGLERDSTTGLSTTVSIENTVILQSEYHGKEIVVFCTAGVDVNAARAGDPAGYDEATVTADVHKGTINLIVSCDVALPPGSLNRAIITLTEAKSAALQELVVGSCYSQELATGSGTDGIIVISNPSSDLTLSNTGAHSKLGEILGRLTKRAVKKALYAQTGLDVLRQLNVYERLKRFNIEEMFLLVDTDVLNKPRNVAIASTVAHLIDQISWGLILPEIALEVSGEVLQLEFEIEENDLNNVHKVKDFILRGMIQFLVDQSSDDK